MRYLTRFAKRWENSEEIEELIEDAQELSEKGNIRKRLKEKWEEERTKIKKKNEAAEADDIDTNTDKE